MMSLVNVENALSAAFGTQVTVYNVGQKNSGSITVKSYKHLIVAMYFLKLKYLMQMASIKELEEQRSCINVMLLV